MYKSMTNKELLEFAIDDIKRNWKEYWNTIRFYQDIRNPDCRSIYIETTGNRYTISWNKPHEEYGEIIADLFHEHGITNTEHDVQFNKSYRAILLDHEWQELFTTIEDKTGYPIYPDWWIQVEEGQALLNQKSG